MFSSQANTCLKMIFVNYAPRFTRMEDVALAADYLSTTDVLMNEWRDDALSLYGLNIGIRGAMVTNSEPARGFKGTIRGYKIFFAKSSDQKVVKTSKTPKIPMFDEIQPHKVWTSEDLPGSVFVCDCVTYANIIKSDSNRSLLDVDEGEFEEEIYNIEGFDDDPLGIEQ